jgi:Flp pilus assembly protein TadG
MASQIATRQKRNASDLRAASGPAASGARPFRRDRRGSISVLSALTLPLIVAVGALVLDLARSYSQLQTLQQVADTAALAGALAYNSTNSSSSVQQTIQNVVNANGWPSSVIQSPATEYLAQDPYNASSKAVQVSLAASSPSWFSKYVLNTTSIPTTVSSLAQLSSTTSACMLSLTTLMINGSVNTGTCAIIADSTGSPAATINGPGVVTASVLGVGGTITQNGTVNATKETGVNVPDPFASLQSTATAGFSGSCPQSSSTSLTPGCYSNFVVPSNQTVTLAAGTYYFNGININTGGKLNATSGSTLIINGNFSPSGNVSVTAPTTGQWAGLALYLTGGMNINNGVQYSINGAVYSPTTTLNLDTASWNVNTCMYVVAYAIVSNGGSSFTLPQHNCASVYFPTATGSSSASLAH